MRCQRWDKEWPQLKNPFVQGRLHCNLSNAWKTEMCVLLFLFPNSTVQVTWFTGRLWGQDLTLKKHTINISWKTSAKKPGRCQVSAECVGSPGPPSPVLNHHPGDAASQKCPRNC